MHKRHPGMMAHARWLAPAAALTLFGCPDEELAPLEPCTVAGVTEDITQSGVDKVDLLFVIDNSGSMDQEQKNLAVQLPRLVQVLASGDFEAGTNKNGVGVQDFQPVSSLNLGVVSTDMGIGGAAVLTTCEKNVKGDDGVLISNVRSTAASCQGVEVEAYQTYMPPSDDAERDARAKEVADRFACVAALGISGCGLEQQLEAMWKAVAPSSNNDFVVGSGHGDAANKGFLRDDAVLAIIHVSDEEDCSITRKGKVLMDQNTDQEPFKDVNINSRCGKYAEDPDYPDLLQPAKRYVDGLLSLKAENKDRVIYAAIVGIHPDMEAFTSGQGEAQVQDFEKILGDARMKTQFTRDMETLPDPVCTLPNPDYVPGDADSEEFLVEASPARRFVKVAQEFDKAGYGQNAVVRSICKDDYTDALDQILQKISKQLSGACLPRELNPNQDGTVACDVVEILAQGDKACDASRGRVYFEDREVADGDVRTVCKINQVAVRDQKLTQAPTPIVPENALLGWYYDNFTKDVLEGCPAGQQQRIAFTENADLAPGAKASFECFSPVGGSPDAQGKAAVGSACEDDTVCRNDRSEEDGYQLRCEQNTRTCQIICEANSQCPDGWACDDGFCSLPTCPLRQSSGT